MYLEKKMKVSKLDGSFHENVISEKFYNTFYVAKIQMVIKSAVYQIKFCLYNM